MDYLEPILRNQAISCYRLHPEYAPELDIYVVSTPSSRRILNHPELVGVEFTRELKNAVAETLRYFPDRDYYLSLHPATLSVVHFLRSGLNFGIREALYDAWGFNTQASSFITSQRQRDQFGRWYIKDDQYRKIEIPSGVSFFIGEIVATGVTVDNGLEIIFRLAKNLGRPVHNVVFFTIGCHKIEKALQKYDALLRQTFREYRKTTLIYLEGKFHLADSRTEARLKIQGTDLMRHPALLAPEFEISQFDRLSSPLERCVIYDGGARAFDIPGYFEDLTGYWKKLLDQGKAGWTLEEALAERWPAAEYRLSFPRFAVIKRRSWSRLERGLVKKAYRAYARRWGKTLIGKSNTSQALVDLCHRRLRELGGTVATCQLAS
jgi:hypothetical protein